MSGQHRRARYEIRHLSSTLAPVHTVTPGVAELVEVFEDLFKTQPIRMTATDTRPLRGAW